MQEAKESDYEVEYLDLTLLDEDSEDGQAQQDTAEENGIQICRKCAAVFARRSDLTRHTKTEHPQKTTPSSKVSSWTESHPCILCGELMESPQKYWAHFRRYHPGGPYPARHVCKHECPQCHKLFRCKSLLRQHMHVHTGTKPFRCSLCSKGFYARLSLKHHIISHSDERPFVCDTCSKSFKFKAGLDRHNLTHTGERPYVCGVCQQSFTTMYWTQMHVRKIHNKEYIPCKKRVRTVVQKVKHFTDDQAGCLGADVHEPNSYEEVSDAGGAYNPEINDIIVGLHKGILDTPYGPKSLKERAYSANKPEFKDFFSGFYIHVTEEPQGAHFFEEMANNGEQKPQKYMLEGAYHQVLDADEAQGVSSFNESENSEEQDVKEKLGDSYNQVLKGDGPQEAHSLKGESANSDV